jgi:hypothetical protein
LAPVVEHAQSARTGGDGLLTVPAASRDLTAISAVAVVLVLDVVALFLPWARSGEVQRNSFELVRSAERLEVGVPWVGPLAVVWFLIPAGAGLALLLLGVGRTVPAALLALAVGLVSAVLGMVVLSSSLDAGIAPVLAVVSGAATAGSSMWLLRRERADP